MEAAAAARAGAESGARRPASSFEAQLDALARKSTAKRTRTARRGARGAKRRRRRTLDGGLEDDDDDDDDDEEDDDDENEDENDDENDDFFGEGNDDENENDDDDDEEKERGPPPPSARSRRSARALLDEDESPEAARASSGRRTRVVSRARLTGKRDDGGGASPRRTAEEADYEEDDAPGGAGGMDAGALETLTTLEAALDGRQHAQGHAFEEVNVDNLLDELLSASRKHGLSNVALQRVVKMASHRKCKKAEVSTLLRCLLPRDPVNGEVIVDLLGLFSSLSLKCKVTALKWLVLVNRKLSRTGTEALHKCYGALFHYVDYESTRAVLCRLLYMLTRRKDVTVFRAERLGTLVSNLLETGQDAGPLLLLSDLYAQYAPDLLGTVPSKFARPRLGFFRSPDEMWAADMDKVGRRGARTKKRGLAGGPAGFAAPRTTQKERHPDRSRGRESKRGAAASDEAGEALPEALAAAARDDEVNVGEVRSTRELARALARGKLAFPDRCTAILRDSMFQYLLCVEPRDDQVMRLRQTLPYLIEEDFFALRRSAGSRTAERAAQLATQAKLMLAMADFADFMQQTLPELENFCIRYLETWNGAHHVDALLRLISRLQPRSYEDLRRDVLLPLQRVFQTATVELKVRVLTCLHSLVRNWAELDWEAQLDRSNSASGESVRSEKRLGPHRFVPLPGGVNYYKVVYELIGFVDQLLVLGLVAEQDHPSLQIAATDFFATMARLHAEQGLPFIVPPSPGIVYRLLLGPSCVGVSAMSEVLVDFLQGFTHLREEIRGRSQSEADAMARARQRGFNNGIDKIEIFNAYIWDYCQILWFGKALPGSDPEPVSSLLFRDAEKQGLVRALENAGVSREDVGRAFSMTSSVTFAGFAADLAERTGLDHAHQLDGLELLRHLHKNHCVGLQLFMKTFIAALNKSDGE